MQIRAKQATAALRLCTNVVVEWRSSNLLCPTPLIGVLPRRAFAMVLISLMPSVEALLDGKNNVDALFGRVSHDGNMTECNIWSIPMWYLALVEPLPTPLIGVSPRRVFAMALFSLMPSAEALHDGDNGVDAI